MSDEPLVALLESIFGGGSWPTAVRLLDGVKRVRAGEPLDVVAKSVGTSKRRLAALADSADVVQDAIGIRSEDVTDQSRASARKALGQMLLGRCAEMVFEDRYRAEMHSEELQLLNVADAGGDTDYRLLNGQGRKLFRINIKFHGSQFRQAKQWVGLEPVDCFALATYKIKSALEKQEEEGKPYFFAIVGVPNLTADSVGSRFPADWLEAAAIVLASRASLKRKFEDAVIDSAVRAGLPAFRSTYEAIESAEWYVLSARRAFNLLREKMFERVLALTVRNFTRMFRGAEVDMHFSLSSDLSPLSSFFEALREDGVVKASTLIERGTL